MKHVVARTAGNRLVVGYPLPGEDGVLCAVSDYPARARAAALAEADRRSVEPRPELPPEERKIVPGFYADQGGLF